MQTTTPAGSMPDLNSDYLLSRVDCENYERDGHVLLREVASRPEVEAYRSAILAEVRRRSAGVAPISERDTYGKAFLQVGSLWTRDDTVARFVKSRRFGKIAADLMGVDSVRVYTDQALFKEPGGGLTPWHQDQQFWPLTGFKTVTMWMPMVDASEEMGTLHFASGSQHLGYLGEIPISDTSEADLSKLVAEHGFRISRAKKMAAGDATFHCGWTLHGAPGNASETMREVMTVIYFEDGARVSEIANESQRSGMRSYFPGLGPGDLAATGINPVVYRRG